jgi:hypothetical protein
LVRAAEQARVAFRMRQAGLLGAPEREQAYGGAVG